MKLSDITFGDMLPAMMRGDRTVKGLSAACNYLLQQVLSAGAVLPLCGNLDTLAETYLDNMAEAVNLKWYNRGATIEQKRAIIRSAESVYRQLGTPEAIEQVARDYFGAAAVKEWWEYNGDPGHFKIEIESQELTEDEITAFSRVVRWVKRASAVLDSITAVDPVLGIVYAGGIYHETEVRYLIGGE